MKKKIKEQKLNEYKWVELDKNLYYYKDKNGIVWQLLRTPFYEIPNYKNDYPISY